MVVQYKVSGVIEVDLDEYEVEELKKHNSETMKKDCLEKILYNRLHWCAETLDHEFYQKIDFENLYIDSDWKYAGNMKAKNEPYGSPLAIDIEDIPTSKKESIEKTMDEIGKRKKTKKH